MTAGVPNISVLVRRWLEGQGREAMEGQRIARQLKRPPLPHDLEAPLPRIEVRDSVKTAIRALADRNPAVLAYDGDHAVGILTRIDVLSFVST